MKCVWMWYERYVRHLIMHELTVFVHDCKNESWNQQIYEFSFSSVKILCKTYKWVIYISTML